MAEIVFVEYSRDFYENTYDKFSWYSCPSCDSHYILSDFYFCPMCGSKIIWNKEQFIQHCKQEELDRENYCNDLIHGSESF
jgi:rRNA maturation endonuclease Nob1